MRSRASSLPAKSSAGELLSRDCAMIVNHAPGDPRSPGPKQRAHEIPIELRSRSNPRHRPARVSPRGVRARWPSRSGLQELPSCRRCSIGVARRTASASGRPLAVLRHRGGARRQAARRVSPSGSAQRGPARPHSSSRSTTLEAGRIVRAPRIASSSTVRGVDDGRSARSQRPEDDGSPSSARKGDRCSRMRSGPRRSWGRRTSRARGSACVGERATSRVNRRARGARPYRERLKRYER